MSDGPVSTAFGRLLAELGARLGHEFAWPSPESGFAAFVFHRAGELGPVPPPKSLAWPSDDRLVHAPSLAAAGYWIGCGEGNAIRDAWLSGMRRLKEREAFPADRQSFPYRPLELLGITSGVVATNDAELSSWITKILERSRREYVNDSWGSGVQLASEALAGMKANVQGTDPAALDLPTASLLRWTASVFGSTPSKELESRILELALVSTDSSIDSVSAAVVFQAVRAAVQRFVSSEIQEHWQVGRRQKDAECVVLSICRRFPLFATRLLDRHNNRPTVKITDEYDVQDLMHALLDLHFDDVRAEEVTPSLGGKSGRMDFLLKAEKLVVETKMTRKGLDQKKVGDELIIDMKRYRTHPDYRTLICLVYDPERICTAPAALENDLSSQDGDFRTVVIVCPKGL